VAFLSLSKTPFKYTRGILLPQFYKVRAIIDKELKKVLTEDKKVKDALVDMMLKGNEVMRRDSY
jgi:hypothetical protein